MCIVQKLQTQLMKSRVGLHRSAWARELRDIVSQITDNNLQLVSLRHPNNVHDYVLEAGSTCLRSTRLFMLSSVDNR